MSLASIDTFIDTDGTELFSSTPANLRRSDVASPSTRGDLAAEIMAFLQAGVDGVFTDDPGVGRAAMDAFLKR